MGEYRYLTYEALEDGVIARVLLNRPEARNAQNRGMLVELDDALRRAEADDSIRVVILGGVGPMFSSGHDIGSALARSEAAPGPDQHPTITVNGGTRKGTES
jgi:enoyl-CoA hydratase